jgi:hypothetical protein
MPASLPARNILDGTALPSTSTMKTSLGDLRDYLAETLGPVGGVFTAGLRNRFINGGMAVDQRNAGAAQTITAAAALAYTVDRWYAYCTGANVTGQQVAGSGNTRFRYRFTGAASVTKIGFAQRIEAANSYDLNGRAVVVGVELANSLLTTVTWSAWYANTTDTFGSLAAPTRTSIGTGTITVNATATRYHIPITLPAAATTGIEIEFSVAAQTSGTWTIGEAQLVAGGASELWREQRPIGLEIALCQYYTRPLFAHGSLINTTLAAVYQDTPPMRTAGSPTLTGLAAIIENYGVAASLAIVDSSATTKDKFRSTISFAATGAVGIPCYMTGLISKEL